MTDEERRAAQSIGGRIGAHRRWARTVDRTAATTPGTTGFLARFEREVDPDGVLTPPERARRAKNALSAYMADLSRRGTRARKQQGSAGMTGP